MPDMTAKIKDTAQTTPKPQTLCSPGIPPRFIPNKLAIKVGTDNTKVSAARTFMIPFRLFEMIVPYASIVPFIISL